MFRAGRLPEDAFYTHSRRHVLTRALGHMPFVDVDMVTKTLAVNDRLLFCTDGLWEMVRNEEIEPVITNSNSPKHAVKNLVELANQNGGVDNISVVVGEFHAR